MTTMRSHYEQRVLNAIDRIAAKQRVEDAGLELKSEWPGPEDLSRAARQLAAHANAARGERIVWVIGVCEKRGVLGVADKEARQWLDPVAKHISDPGPDVEHHFVMAVGDLSVVLLVFATDRAPYLWRNPKCHQGEGDVIEWEVPWRALANTRSATRQDLLRLLAPASRMPEVEPISAICDLLQPDGLHEHWRLRLEFELYIESVGQHEVVIPLHRCGLTTSVDEFLSVESWHVEDSSEEAATAPQNTRSSIRMSTAGYCQIAFERRYVPRPDRPRLAADCIQIELSVPFASRSQSLTLPIALTPHVPGRPGVPRWGWPDQQHPEHP